MQRIYIPKVACTYMNLNFCISKPDKIESKPDPISNQHISNKKTSKKWEDENLHILHRRLFEHSTFHISGKKFNIRLGTRSNKIRIATKCKQITFNIQREKIELKKEMSYLCLYVQ